MIISDVNTSNKVVITCKVYTSWSPLSLQQSGVETWQRALLSVERGLLHHLPSILYLYSSVCMCKSLLMKAFVGSRNV